MHVILESVMKRTVPDEDHKWMYLLVAVTDLLFIQLAQYDCLYCVAILLMASVSFICYHHRPL